MRKCVDHLGREYSSFKSMCRTYGKTDITVRNRMKSGMSLEEALTIPLHRSRSNEPIEERTDHLGNVFDSIQDMCDYWHINRNTYISRVKDLKWSKQKALETKTKKRPNIDHLGNAYESFDAMCEHWQRSSAYVSQLLYAGKSLKEALDPNKDIKRIFDHTGKEYQTFEAMCQAWGKTAASVYRALNNNKTLEYALTSKSKCMPIPSTDHLGKEYPSFNKMCYAWNRDPLSVKYYENKGHTRQYALEHAKQLTIKNKT